MTDEQAMDADRNETLEADRQVEPWTPDESAALAEDIHQGRTPMCPSCGGWVQGTVLLGGERLRKAVRIECNECGRSDEAFGGPDNENQRIPTDVGEHLEHDRRAGRALVCPLCHAPMRLLRDELPTGIEIFAFDCLACGASYYEAGGVL